MRNANDCADKIGSSAKKREIDSVEVGLRVADGALCSCSYAALVTQLW